LGIFVQKRNLKESVFVLTINGLGLGYFMYFYFSPFTPRHELICKSDQQHSFWAVLQSGS